MKRTRRVERARKVKPTWPLTQARKAKSFQRLKRAKGTEQVQRAEQTTRNRRPATVRKRANCRLQITPKMTARRSKSRKRTTSTARAKRDAHRSPPAARRLARARTHAGRKKDGQPPPENVTLATPTGSLPCPHRDCRRGPTCGVGSMSADPSPPLLAPPLMSGGGRGHVREGVGTTPNMT